MFCVPVLLFVFLCFGFLQSIKYPVARRAFDGEATLSAVSLVGDTTRLSRCGWRGRVWGSRRALIQPYESLDESLNDAYEEKAQKGEGLAVEYIARERKRPAGTRSVERASWPPASSTEIVGLARCAV